MKKRMLFLGSLLMSGMLVLGGCKGAEEKPAKEAEVEDDRSAEDEEVKEEVKEEEKEETKEEVTDDPVEEEPVDDDAEEPEDGDTEELLSMIYEQYYDIISGLDEKWDQFMFVYFDNDDIPDVIVSSTTPDANDLREYQIITRSRAGAEVNDDLRDGVASAGGYRGDLYYVPSAGILYERTFNAPLNNPGDYVYLLDDGHLTLYATGRTEVTDGYEGPDDKEHMTWFWNDEEVSAEEYEKKLMEETNNLSGDALSSLFYVDRESMLNRLSKTID